MNSFLNAFIKVSIGLLIVHIGQKLIDEGNSQLWH